MEDTDTKHTHATASIIHVHQWLMIIVTHAFSGYILRNIVPTGIGSMQTGTLSTMLFWLKKYTLAMSCSNLRQVTATDKASCFNRPLSHMHIIACVCNSPSLLGGYCHDLSEARGFLLSHTVLCNTAKRHETVVQNEHYFYITHVTISWCRLKYVVS